MAKHPYLECGRIVGTHGVRGMVRLESYCNTPGDLAKLKRVYYQEKDGSYSEWHVLRASVQKQMVLLALEGVDTLEAAIPLKGTVLWCKREDMPRRAGDVFIADLLGLPVKDVHTGEQYGVLEDVSTSGVQDLYVVREENGNTFLIPCVPAFVRRLETEGEEAGVYVHLIEGLRE